MIIYKITCKTNNKIYIGQTSESLEKRFSRHIGYQKDNSDSKFYRAIRKYGAEAFYIEKIDEALSQDELDEKELYWIKRFNSAEKGYNTKESKGKCGGDTLSNHPYKKDISEKIRVSKLGDKNPMRINGGLKGERNGMYGRYGGLNPYARKIVSLYESGELYKIYDSISEARDDIGVTNSGMICSRLKGKTKSSYKGFYFKYYEDYVKSQETIESIA